MALRSKQIIPLPHHIQQQICSTRARYRQGRKQTAVKVYNASKESQYLLIQDVPSVGAKNELNNLLVQYGLVEDLYALDEYPAEDFTEVYLAKYKNIQSARFAKRKLDGKSFFGGVLHVCYAPEFETPQDVRYKLQERRKTVASIIRRGHIESNNNQQQGEFSRINPRSNSLGYQRQKNQEKPVEPKTNKITYIWAGQEYTVDEIPSGSTEPPVEPVPAAKPTTTTTSLLPRQLMRNKVQKTNSVLSPSVSHAYPEDESMLSTTLDVRSKMANMSVPNLDVTFKRKRK